VVDATDNALSLTFMHLVAARASSDFINGQYSDGNQNIVATETDQEPTPLDLMSPALE
jgi:hypothetical protein